jgi:hypothetical protein
LSGIQTCEIGGCEDQRKRQPRPQEAGEHFKAPVDQYGNDKEIHGDDEGKET